MEVFEGPCTWNDLPYTDLEGQRATAVIAGVEDRIVGCQPALVVASAWYQFFA